MPSASCLSTTAKARAGRREPEIWTFLALRAYLDCLLFGESRYLPSIPLDWPRIAFHKRLGGFSRGTVAAPRPLMDAVNWTHPFAPVTLWLHGAPCFDWICWISAPFLLITSSYGRHGISCCARETPSFGAAVVLPLDIPHYIAGRAHQALISTHDRHILMASGCATDVRLGL